MKKVTKRYVCFLLPGSFFAEEWTKDIDHIDPARIKWPDSAYCFTLNERTDVIDGGKVYTGEPRQIGPKYYHPDSKVETLHEVRRNPKATETLIRNMVGNDWEQIVWSRWGNWPQLFDPAHDVVLKP